MKIIIHPTGVPDLVKKVNEGEGVTFLLAEQNTNVALRYAHYGYILESGRVVMDGEAAALRENPDVAVEVENKVREAMGIPLLPTTGDAG